MKDIPKFITDPKEAFGALESLAIHTFENGVLVTLHPSSFHITKDGIVDYVGDLYLRGFGHDYIPVKFGTVTGDFSVSNINSLHGCPHTVGGNFRCSRSNITNLNGGPRVVGETYYLTFNNFLTSLEGAPEQVDHLRISKCYELIDPRHFKNINIKGAWSLSETHLHELVKIFRGNFKDSLDYNYIRDYHGMIGYMGVNLFRFKEALHEFDIKIIFESQKDRMFVLESDGERTPIAKGTKDRFSKYVFLDDDGVRVNFDGERWVPPQLKGNERVNIDGNFI